jgi:hypothetical protein
MEGTERWVCFEHGHVVLAASGTEKPQVLNKGDVIELFEHSRFQPVEVCDGGSGGWYYVTAEGQPARFAVGQRVQGYRPYRGHTNRAQ